MLFFKVSAKLHRYMLIACLGSATVAVLIALILLAQDGGDKNPFILFIFGFLYDNSQIILSSVFILFVSRYFLKYLQSGGRQSDFSTLSSQIDKIHMENRELAYKNKIILDKYSSKFEFTPKQKEEIKLEVIRDTKESTITEIFKLEAEKLTKEIKSRELEKDFSEIYQHTINRLQREIVDLRLRSNMNLVIGMLITFGGLALLWTTVSMVDTSELLRKLASEGGESDTKFYKNLILPLAPRLSLVVFLEIFAYFFLRLYKEGLSEIKYFQNELTNIELKITALNYSRMTNDSDSLRIIIESLSKTERNFILEKGQTTVDLEKAKSDSEVTKGITKAIPNLFKDLSKNRS